METAQRALLPLSQKLTDLLSDGTAEGAAMLPDACVLDDPTIADCIRALDLAKTDDEWNTALSSLSFFLLIRAQASPLSRPPQAGVRRAIDRIQELAARIKAGPPRRTKGRQTADQRSYLDGRMLRHFEGSRLIRTPAEGARVLMEAYGIPYKEAMSRALRAAQRGFFSFGSRGVPYHAGRTRPR